MVNILIYNEYSNQMEFYVRELDEPMPHNADGTLTVGEFRSNSNSELIWSSRRTMEAWNVTRTAWGRPIYVGYAFKRIGEGGHANQSQHYAGTAFDVGQNLSTSERNRLHSLASGLGVWSYVEPLILTPTWVHFDKRQGTPACDAGFPVLIEGLRGVYVATLQDALSAVGIPGVGIDGIFGIRTTEGVMLFQAENGLTVDGIVGCQTWTLLTSMVNGIYR